MASQMGEVYQPKNNVYKFRMSMKYVLDGEVYEIDTVNIRSLVIDNDYRNYNMPTIYTTISISKKLFDKMVENQDRSTIILKLEKAVANSDMPNMYENYIEDKFIYFIAEDTNKTDGYDYSEEEDREDIFRITTMGLLCQDHVNKNKKALNGVINGKLSSAMYYLTGHLPIVIEPPSNNIMLKNKYIPPLNSVAKSLKYLNSIHVLYDTEYRFFIDFECAYLLSSSGKAVPREDEDITKVYVVCRNSYDAISKIQGLIISERDSLYMIDVDGIDSTVADNHAHDKVFDTLAAMDLEGDKTKSSITNKDDDSVIVQKTKAIRIPNGNTGIVSHMTKSIDGNSVQILVMKNDVDPSVFSMNKEYIVRCDDVYNTTDYNGNYVLTRRREIYIRSDEETSMSMMLLLEKVPPANG